MEINEVIEIIEYIRNNDRQKYMNQLRQVFNEYINRIDVIENLLVEIESQTSILESHLINKDKSNINKDLPF